MTKLYCEYLLNVVFFTSLALVIKYCVLIKEIVKIRMGYAPSVLRYPYRVKTKNGKIKLVYDPSKGLKSETVRI